MKRFHMTCAFVATLALAFTVRSLVPITVLPAASSPDHHGVTSQPAETVEAAGVAQQFDMGAAPVPQWWKLYRPDALNVLVEEGLRNNPTLIAMQKTLSAAQEELRAQVGASTLSSLDAGTQAAHQRTSNLTGVDPEALHYNVFVGQLQAHYTFDLFGITRYTNAASTAWVDARGCELEVTRRVLAANIVGAVTNAAVLDQQIALTERLVAMADTTARDSQRQYELGTPSHAQALISTQNAAPLAVTLPQLHQRRAVSIHALTVLPGRTSDAVPAVSEFSSPSLPNQVPVAASSDLLRARPDICTAAAAIRVTSVGTGRVTAQFFLGLSLTVSLGWGGLSWPALLLGADGLQAVGAGLNQPIFHDGALMAHCRATLELYDATILRYESAVLPALENVTGMLAALENDAQTLASTEVASTTAHTAFGETALRRHLGALPASVEQSGGLQYLSAQLDTVRATSWRMSDTVALLQTMGELLANIVQTITKD